MGDVLGFNQREEARRANRQVEALANLYRQQYETYMPGVLEALRRLSEAGPTPAMMGAYNTARADVANQGERLYGGFLRDMSQRGLVGSSAMTSGLSRLARASAEGFGRAGLGYGLAQDERQEGALRALAGLLSGSGSTAGSLYGQAGQGYASDTGLMGLVGSTLGTWAGGGFGGSRSAGPGYEALMQDSDLRTEFNAPPPLRPYRGYSYGGF
jgi:hypothetical protein